MTLPEIMGAQVEIGSAVLELTEPVIDRPLAGGTAHLVAMRSRAILRVTDVGTFAIADGTRIRFEPAGTLTSSATSVWLHGTVTALLLAQRGEFALHASVVDVDGLGVAVAGRRGAGKSTTALRLAQRGHPLVTDDVSPLQNEGRFSVHPFGRPIHVAPETARGLGLDVSAAPTVTGDDSKLTLPPPASAPVPLRAIAVLRAGSDLAVGAVRKRGLRAHRLVRLHTYRARMLQQLFHTELFTWAGEVAAEIPVYVVTRPAQGWTVDPVADVLERIAAVTAEDRAAPVRPARSRTGP